MRVETETFLMGEILGHRLVFTAQERIVLAKASALAGQARAMNLDEDSDTLLAEVEHGCRELIEDSKGLRVEIYPVAR